MDKDFSEALKELGFTEDRAVECSVEIKPECFCLATCPCCGKEFIAGRTGEDESAE